MQNSPTGRFDRDSSDPQDRPHQDPVRPMGGPDPYGPQDEVPGTARRSGGFGAFPFPHYSTRTRSGTQVSVGGCCLPLPIGCLMTLSVAAGAVLAARSRRR